MPIPAAVDRRLVNDPALLPIADKVERGDRLTPAEGVQLFRTPDLVGLGAMADAVNRVKHHGRVTFAANQHINPTNICTLRKTCVFCSYARLPKEDGAYRYTLEQVLEESDSANSTLTREFHIVGGLDMKAGLAYYAAMFRALKARHPQVHIKALTAVEIAHIARIEKMAVRDVLLALREAGLDTMPGGGAEVFSPGVRATIADKKLAGDEWIRVHREAHQLGIRTNCTMLYGHVESIQDRIDHLTMLRDLQDETGGFLAYIPLAYHPDHNELGETLQRQGTATSGFDDLKNLAVGRLYLDTVDHIKTHWVMVTPFISQMSLDFGVNDMEGTMVREKIYHEAGAHTAQAMSLDALLRLIRGARRIPVERDSLYHVLRTFDPVPPPDGVAAGGASRAAHAA
ncbi:MAG TPA: aminofutalosine synthase MqnE [Gemmatimonadaceae bacterium]|nr:aminofutalosine synthase MqnE [Gemmatimonadaceae bacterium]